MWFEEVLENTQKSKCSQDSTLNDEQWFEFNAHSKWKKLSDFIFHQDKRELRRSLKRINYRLYTNAQHVAKWVLNQKYDYCIDILKNNII